MVTKAAPRRLDNIQRDQVLQLAIRDLEESRHLDVVDLKGHGDDVIVEAVVPQPDRHRMQRWQLPDGRGSIHASERKEEQAAGLECAVLSFRECST